MGDLSDPFMRNQNATVQAHAKAQNRSNVLQLKLITSCWEVNNIAYGTRTSEGKIKREFEAYGPVKQVHLVSGQQTNKPEGYAFIEYLHTRDMKAAYKQGVGRKIDDRRVLVDVERGRTVPNWRPRRLGGGLGTSRVVPGEKIAGKEEQQQQQHKEECPAPRRQEYAKIARNLVTGERKENVSRLMSGPANGLVSSLVIDRERAIEKTSTTETRTEAETWPKRERESMCDRGDRDRQERTRDHDRERSRKRERDYESGEYEEDGGRHYRKTSK